MVCPKCNHENDEDAKFCVSCGANLQDCDGAGKTNDSALEPEPVAQTAQDIEGAHGADQGNSDAGGEQRAQNSIEENEGKGSILERAKAFPKPALYGASAAVVLAIVALAAVFFMNGKPGEAELRAAIQEGASVSIAEGEYNDAAELSLDSIEITSVEKISGTDAAVAKSLLGTDECYTVVGSVKLSGDAAEVSETVSCSFFKQDGKWAAIGSPSATDQVWTAKAGPSETKVLENIDYLLSKASADSTSEDNEYSSGMYDGAEFKVTKNDLDGNTAKLAIHASQDSSSYFTCEGNLTVSFTFKNGTWALDNAKADDTLFVYDFSKMIGTWKGTYEEPDYTQIYYCGGAKEYDTTIVIDSYDKESGTLSGKFSTVAHYHDDAKNDGSTEGDTQVNDIAFTIDASRMGTYIHGSTDEIVQEQGTGLLPAKAITFSLTFKREADDSGSSETDAVEALIKSNWFESIESYSNFSDDFVLTKES